MGKGIEKEQGCSQSLEEVFARLLEEGRTDEHINPIDWDAALPVDEDFPYIPKGWLKLKYAFWYLFGVLPNRWYQSKIVYKVRVEGRHNLKGISSAIVTSNHVAIFDCLVNAYALRPHRVKTVAAEFNNRRGRLGDLMRAGGMLPLSPKPSVLRKFSQAIGHYLSKNNYILFYPEQSMWPLYDRPRPFKTGAAHYAVKFDVPLIPMFITYREGKRQGEKYFTVNIMPPLFADKALSPSDQIKDLTSKAYQACLDLVDNPKA